MSCLIQGIVFLAAGATIFFAPILLFIPLKRSSVICGVLVAQGIAALILGAIGVILIFFGIGAIKM